MARPRKPAARRPRDDDPDASPAVEAVTALWATSTLTVAGADLAAALTRLYYASNPGAEKIGLLSGLLFLAAAITGLITLVLTPMVLRVRRDRPPHGFIALAVVAGSAPLVALFVNLLR